MASAPMTAPLRVVGYTRVSTDYQADEGVSLEMQRTRLAAYAVATGVQLVELVTDAGVSAKSLARPGLQRALSLLEQGHAEGLVVLRLDRLTRSVRDLGELVEKYFATRFSLLSVGDHIDTRSAGGRLVLHVLMSVSQWEREIIGERTREALAQLKAQGQRLGAPPLESTTERGLDASRRALHLRHEGLTLRAIAERLTIEGYATQKGGRWQAETVRLLVRRAGRLPENKLKIVRLVRLGLVRAGFVRVGFIRSN